ncbi:MAG: hypothetical protein U9N59_03285 [Campylobacterota bacterium]|nr:hypothetical protein [Campylobacterota bacterium]
MHGRTKSFFEDIAIGIVALASIYGLYYLYSTYNTEKNIEQPIVVEKNIEPKLEPKLEPEPKIIAKQLVVKTKKEPIIKDINRSVEEKKVIEKEPEIVVEEIDEVVQKKESIVKDEKNVDLKMLRAFLIETQYKIRKNIIYPEDTNGTKQDRFMRLKITILKDGSYEQLRFVEGNKEIFDLNKENILNLFPLVIDEKISGDFPRYFRMKINK